jgi:membrane protein implicated in regulation of membrane protease activity
MLTYVLIGLSFALVGVAGLQLMYLFYMDRVMRERKLTIRELERTNKRLTKQLEAAEEKVAMQRARIQTILPDELEDETWANVIDVH